MRFLFIPFMAMLAIGLVLLVGRLLIAIWMVAVIGAILFFAFRGIREFIRRGRGHSMPFDYYHRQSSLSGPEDEAHYEQLVPVWRQTPEELSKIRVIPVE